MKAMILAAGFGTRLKPLTDNIPKALVSYRNAPMIANRIRGLKQSGFEEIIVNVFHHKDKMIKYFAENDFGIPVSLVIEDEILGTGGGILNAESLLRNGTPFTVVNVDIDFNIDFRQMIRDHNISDPFATIAVQKRKSSRYLEFDNNMNLVARKNDNSKQQNLYAFNGVHVISQRIFDFVNEKKFSDILDIYFDVINGKKDFVKGFDSGDVSFKDLGKPENLL